MARLYWIIALAFGFLYGIVVGNLFPTHDLWERIHGDVFGALANVEAQWVLDPEAKARADLEAAANAKAIAAEKAATLDEDLEFSIISENRDVLLSLRDRLREKIIPENDEGVILANRDGDDIILQTTYYGVQSKAVLSETPHPGSCLRVYIQGHDGDPFDAEHHNLLRNHFMEIGCDVLSMSMLGLGLNEGNAQFPARFGQVDLDMFEARRHGNYALFFDADNPQLDPLSLFIFPQYRMIAGLIDDYDNIAVLGISGGGWYVVWLAALMPEIDQSISYAGSLPLPYHQFGWNHGDWEQTYSAVYSTVSYIELYQLMTLGDGENRPAYLVYNSDDPCCFRDPYASHFKRVSEGVPGLNYKVFIERSDTHSMNVELVKRLLEGDSQAHR